jgi:hypothetical protein
MLMRVRRMRMRLWGMSEVGGLLGWERESMQIRTTCCVRKSGVRLGADFHSGCVHLYKLGILMSGRQREFLPGNSYDFSKESGSLPQSAILINPLEPQPKPEQYINRLGLRSASEAYNTLGLKKAQRDPSKTLVKPPNSGDSQGPSHAVRQAGITTLVHVYITSLTRRCTDLGIDANSITPVLLGRVGRVGHGNSCTQLTCWNCVG